MNKNWLSAHELSFQQQLQDIEKKHLIVLKMKQTMDYWDFLAKQ